MSVVLDSGALSLLAVRDARLHAVIEAVQREGGLAFVPSVCLVESLTGRPMDAALNARLKRTQVVGLDEPTARLAAARRAAVDGDDAADPVVVATAAMLDAVVITTDPGDMLALAEATLPRVAVIDPRGG